MYPRLPWIVVGGLMAHVAEELPRFPEWATRHFGTTTPGWFVLSHIPVFLAAGVIAWAASRPTAGTRAIRWLWIMMSALVVNGLFHVVTTAWFLEYSPGLATAVACYGPLTVACWHRLPKPDRSTLATGILLSLVLTGTLWLDVPI